MSNREVHHTFYKSSHSLFFQFIINDGTYPSHKNKWRVFCRKVQGSSITPSSGLGPLFFWLVFSLTGICSGIYKGEKREIQPANPKCTKWFYLKSQYGLLWEYNQDYGPSPQKSCVHTKSYGFRESINKMFKSVQGPRIPSQTSRLDKSLLSSYSGCLWGPASKGYLSKIFQQIM